MDCESAAWYYGALCMARSLSVVHNAVQCVLGCRILTVSLPLRTRNPRCACAASQWGIGAFGLIIDAVAPLLDEYMRKHRKELVKDREDPGTLFFCRRVTPLCKHTLNHLIARLTHTFADKRVTADTMRISFIDY